MRKKGSKNKNPYIRESDYMNVDDIAKKLDMTKPEVEATIKRIFYKFRKHLKNNNIQKQDYL
jgi:hypothetical protein